MIDPALYALFAEPVLDIEFLDPGYTDHGSDVWRVTLASRTVIVRASRLGQSGGPFWEGLEYLFGVDPRPVHRMGRLNALLRQLGAFPVPAVLSQGYLGTREAVVVEHLPGEPLPELNQLPSALLENFGVSLARLHSCCLDWFGTVTDEIRRPLEEFHPRLAGSLELLTNRWYADRPEICAILPEMLDQAKRLPAPRYSCPVLIDQDASQYLWDGAHITGLVDTEAFAAAPPELDLVGMEYLLNRRSAAALARGYRSVMPLPRLDGVRRLYRFLYLLLDVQGETALQEWMARKIFFP
ncbi:MAG TPA: aminoglycoside phosphotransferase family protein [Anaerolineaceae bacterium]